MWICLLQCSKKINFKIDKADMRPFPYSTWDHYYSNSVIILSIPETKIFFFCMHYSVWKGLYNTWLILQNVIFKGSWSFPLARSFEVDQWKIYFFCISQS